MHQSINANLNVNRLTHQRAQVPLTDYCNGAWDPVIYLEPGVVHKRGLTLSSDLVTCSEVSALLNRTIAWSVAH